MGAAGDGGKKKNARPVPLDGEAQCAVPLSCFARKASIAAQTEGITPPAPGRTFAAPPGGPFAAGGGPSLSLRRGYSFRSLRYALLYYQRRGTVSRQFIREWGVFLAAGQAVCYNGANNRMGRRASWTESV